jgi:transcriptional regulator with XRE-family HTH domain
MIEVVPRSYSSWPVPGLRTVRLSKLWTQRDLAERAQVSLATIVRVENGEAAQAGTIRKLAGALGVDPGQLMRESKPD